MRWTRLGKIAFLHHVILRLIIGDEDKGGRLLPKLLESGYRVRALGRSTAKLKARLWAKHPMAELAVGDVLDYESLRKAAAGFRV